MLLHPQTREIDNNDRAAFAAEALDAYARRTGMHHANEQLAVILQSFLCDLFHLVEAERISLDAAVHSGRIGHHAERDPGQARDPQPADPHIYPTRVASTVSLSWKSCA